MEVVHLTLEHPDGVPIPAEEALSRAQNGDILVFKNAVGELGLLNPFIEETLDAISQHASPELAQTIREQGFEQMHNILDGQQILDTNNALRESMHTSVPLLVKKFARELLNYTKKIYIDPLPVVRFFVPQDTYLKHQGLFQKSLGFLRLQGPHHDSWFDHSLEGLNLWIAIGAVDRGNGLLMYPSNWGTTLPHNGNYQMPKKQHLGKPINFKLDPGDVLFFRGEHLHSSELNITENTRYVLTTRFALSKPNFTESNQWRAWFNSALLDTPLAFMSTWGAYLSPRALRWITKKTLWQLVPGRIRGPIEAKWDKERVAKTKTSSDTYAEPDSELSSERWTLSDFEDGQVRAVSSKACVVRTGDQLYGLSRFCTHEGADLSLGYTEGDNLLCPWHRLPVDVKTGKLPCQSLKPVAKYPLKQNEDGSFSFE